jgi:1,4-dihydroxy-2-naphthoate octaprenyltransferase
VQKWITAIRIQTLPIGILPVLLAGALSWKYDVIQWDILLCATTCAVLMQIVSNLVNDLYDARKGADSDERLGPVRVISSKQLSPEIVSRVAWILGGLAFILGQYLVFQGGIEILGVGVISLFFAWAYTGGKYPLAYHGFGEVLALIFFGVVPVCTTYYIQAHSVHIDVVVASLIPGILAAEILLVNNIRDIESDKKVGKRTIAVKMGAKLSKTLYCLNLILVYGLTITLLLESNYSLIVVGGSLPLAIFLMKHIWQAEGREFNNVLVKTVGFMIMHTSLTVIGVIIYP